MTPWVAQYSSTALLTVLDSSEENLPIVGSIAWPYPLRFHLLPPVLLDVFSFMELGGAFVFAWLASVFELLTLPLSLKTPLELVLAALLATQRLRLFIVAEFVLLFLELRLEVAWKLLLLEDTSGCC